MKQIALTIKLLLITVICTAQNAQIEKSLTGIQIGLFGADLYNEYRLADNVALKSELSLFPAVWGGDLYDNTGFAIYPVITVQPKYYYNLSKRAEKGKNTRNNSANYFSLQTRYIPDWFVISSSNVAFANQVHIIPTFGIRRSFAQNFNYEFKVGLGYGTTIGNEQNTTGAVLDLGIKIGFDF